MGEVSLSTTAVLQHTTIGELLEAIEERQSAGPGPTEPSSRRALALAVTIQFVQVEIRAAPGCIIFGCTSFGSAIFGCTNLALPAYFRVS